MWRRPGNPSRRHGDSAGSGGGLFSLNSKSRSAPYFPILLIVLGTLVIFAYLYRGSGGLGGNIRAFSRIEGGFSCTAEVHRAVPVLKKAYGDSMHKVLHVGPDTCLVVSNFRKEDETGAWGVEPYDIEDADGHCRALVRCIGLPVSKIPQQNPSRFG